MTRSILRKTYTGFTGEIGGVRITLDGPNVRIKVNDPTGEAYLTVDQFARLARNFTQRTMARTEDFEGWLEDDNAIIPKQTPLFINGVKKTREKLKEEAMMPKYFRDRLPDADDVEAMITPIEGGSDGFLL